MRVGTRGLAVELSGEAGSVGGCEGGCDVCDGSERDPVSERLSFWTVICPNTYFSWTGVPSARRNSQRWRGASARARSSPRGRGMQAAQKVLSPRGQATSAPALCLFPRLDLRIQLRQQPRPPRPPSSLSLRTRARKLRTMCARRPHLLTPHPTSSSSTSCTAPPTACLCLRYSAPLLRASRGRRKTCISTSRAAEMGGYRLVSSHRSSTPRSPRPASQSTLAAPQI